MKKGGFIKDALILFAITLIAGICLGGVYEVTKAPIEAAKIAESMEIYKLVYPDAAEFKFNQAIQDQVDISGETLAASGENLGKVEVNVALEAVDASGAVIGHILSVTSKDGYSGAIKISMGVTTEGVITGVDMLEIAETPGLGMNAANEEFKGQYKGVAVDAFTVVKGTASADNEIDSISGATITSSAVTNAVNAGLYFLQNCITE